ncbi:unnamed protein product, partial [marine sediment metagenome]
MVAFALRKDGWWLRSDIIWNKPNPMPESVTDRPTKSHEYLFLLTKSKKYYYDADAIREEYTEPLNRWGGEKTKPTDQSKGNEFAIKERTGRERRPNGSGRNKRSVWKISTKPYPETHFAVFPEELVEPCILAGTSPKACNVCGAPWERMTEKGKLICTGGTENPSAKKPSNAEGYKRNDAKDKLYHHEVKTIGWRPTCDHHDDKGSCIILDPFAGSGTVLQVARKHSRSAIGIDINPDYKELAEKR